MPQPEKHKNHLFEDQTIRLDGKVFDGCRFVRCVLEFGGTALPRMPDCTFYESDITMVDAAHRTCDFLSSMSIHPELEHIVAAFADDLQGKGRPAGVVFQRYVMDA